MKNGISHISTFIMGSRLLFCDFFRITKLGTDIRADFGDGAITISGPPTIEETTLPCEYENRFCEFFEELKDKVIVNIADVPHRGDLANIRLALQTMNINFQRTLEEFSVNDLEKIIVKISLETEVCAYASLSSLIDHVVNPPFNSTPDEVINFLRKEIK